jgi:hypothetical protein
MFIAVRMAGWKLQQGNVWGSEDVLVPGSGWRWFVRFTPQPFYPRGNSPGCTLDTRLCVSDVSAGERRQIPASAWIRTQISRSCSMCDRVLDWTQSNQAEWFLVVWAGDVGWLCNVTRHFIGVSFRFDCNGRKKWGTLLVDIKCLSLSETVNNFIFT